MEMSYIRLLVDKFDECYAFYADVIGMEAVWGKPGEVYASFRANGTTMLSLYKRDLMMEALEMNAQAGKINANSVLILQSDNMDADYTALKAKGVQMINEPHDMPGWGCRCFHLTDPEGNIVEVNCELPKDAWDDDIKNHPDAANHDG